MGRRIRELRLEKGLSQEELGRIVGVRRAAVNKWETGQVKNLRRDTIETLSRFFDVSPSYLIHASDAIRSRFEARCVYCVCITGGISPPPIARADPWLRAPPVWAAG